MYNYYKDQLEKIVLNGQFPAKVKITDSEGNQTNYLDINEESAKELIEWLERFGYKQTKPFAVVENGEQLDITEDQKNTLVDMNLIYQCAKCSTNIYHCETDTTLDKIETFLKDL